MTHITLVYEHTDFVIINKPVGMPMHDPVNGVCQVLSRQLGGQKLYLVHRLDTDTSGCLLLGKHAKAAAALSLLFAQRNIQKTYIALSDQKPKKKQGKIAGDMQKTRQGNYKLKAQTNNPAVTFFSTQMLENHRLFYLKPITGKTHQLRVALKTLGSPIIGDKRYKGTPSDRLYLHSYEIAFRYSAQSGNQSHKQNAKISDKLNTESKNAMQNFAFTCLPESGKFFNEKTLSSLTLATELVWPRYQHPGSTIFEENQ